jgi:hypothetical protein
MPECNKCGSKFPYKVEIDGRIRNLKNRKYCLNCSPFGKHNTRRLHDENIVEGLRLCKGCKKPMSSVRRWYCYTCNSNRRRTRVAKKVYDIVGLSCWKCGYSIGEQSSLVLCFHHVDPSTKKIKLTRDEMARYPFEIVLKEIRKCVSLCTRCHTEYHYTDLISDEDIAKIYRSKWEEIDVFGSKP